LIPRRKHIFVDLTKCYSVCNIGKSTEDGLGDLGSYENGPEGYLSKVGQCCEYHEMHRTLPVEMWLQHFEAERKLLVRECTPWADKD